MKSKLRWALYLLAVIAQLVLPAMMIRSSETILDTGARFLFRTAPVDPVDAFRGKYVALGFSANDFTAGDGDHFKPHQKVFAVINRDSAGFAQVIGLERKKPSTGDYIAVTVTWQNNSVVRFRYPFEKYFLEESKAQKAEQLYREHSVRGRQDTYLVVRVKNGSAVIEDLVIGGLPVAEALKTTSAP